MTAPLVDQLAGILRRARGTRPRTELAKTAGVTPVALHHVETGAANPTLKRVAELGDLYGIRLGLVDLDQLDAHLDDVLADERVPSAHRRRKAITGIIRDITAQEPTT